MRRLLVWTPQGQGRRVDELAQAHGSSAILALEGRAGDLPVDVLLVELPNRRVGDLIGAASDVEGTHVSLFPHGLLALHPPASRAAEQVTDVTLRSPIEVFLGGLQSVGSWRGFLAYAAAAGVVVWTGLLTNTVYLLVAAMLIAPFAGPAMNAAIATARGDRSLLARSLGRYLAALGTAVGVAALCTLVFRQEVITEQMAQVASISNVAVVLPLMAGVAGAVNLTQSERSSLVSGAATGMLVAAALAPPAGLVGMSLVLGEWPYVRSGLFLLGLQLVAINLAGAAVFRTAGLRPRGVRFVRGNRLVAILAAALSVLVLAALLLWQFSDRAGLQRASVATQAETIVQRVVGEQGARPLEVDARFPPGPVPGPPRLLVTAYVEQDAAREEALEAAIAAALRRELPGVTPLVAVTAVSAP